MAVVARALGSQTNNYAEYSAVLFALRRAHELGAQEVALILDSKLVVEQLLGRWRVKNPGLIALHEQAREALAGFRRWSVRHEPRAMNRAADALANLALDDPAAARAAERRSGLDAPGPGAAKLVRRQEPRPEHGTAQGPAPFYAREGLHVETYDARYPPIPGGDDVAFYLEAARRHPGPVLELGVGTGRVAISLAGAGISVTGIDASAPMLRRAEKKLAELSPKVRDRVVLLRGDMSDFALKEAVSLVIFPFRAFAALLTADDQRSALECARRSLRRGGALIIDLFDPRLEQCLPGVHGEVDRGSVVHPVTGNRVEMRVLERANEPFSQILRERWRFTELDLSGRPVRTEEEILALRWTYRYEMRHLLELVGFTALEEFSDYAGSPPAYGLEQLWVGVKS